MTWIAAKVSVWGRTAASRVTNCGRKARKKSAGFVLSEPLQKGAAAR